MKKIVLAVIISVIPLLLFAQQTTLESFWDLKWHQSIDAVRKHVKTRIGIDNGIVESDKDRALLVYKDCVFNGNICDQVSMLFYQDQLCCAVFTIHASVPGDKMKTMQLELVEKYGPPIKGGGDAGSFWQFADKQFLMIHKTQTAVKLHYDDGDLYKKLAGKLARDKTRP